MRVLVILSTVVASLGVATWALVTFGSSTAVQTGRWLYPHRGAQAMLAGAARGPQPALVWLGDSTLANGKGIVSYPALLQRTDLDPRRLSSCVVGSEGLDTYAFHSLVWETLALHPRVVVLIANLRVFSIGGATTRTFDDLTAFVPTHALPELLAQPFYFRGMTAPGLLLMRTLRYDWALDAFFWIQGTRDEIQHVSAWEVLGPEEPPTAANPLRAWVAGWQGTAQAYDCPITPRLPLVRFMAASVAQIEAAGVRALVIVSPIAYEQLAKAGHYDPAVFAGRIDVLRQAVERERGTFLDLHRALEEPLFRDRSGHFTADGMARMRQLVWPTLFALLDGPPLHPRPSWPPPVPPPAS